MVDWDDYLRYLDEGTYSVKIITSNLSPTEPMNDPESFQISGLNYTLWPFQEKVLSEMGESTLILGLPTGLGKTYIAGAKLFEESMKKPIRVLFLAPSIPLGVQQVLFAKEKLGVNALFVSGGISPVERDRMKVWNNGFVVATPQTFYNDSLSQYGEHLKHSRNIDDPIEYLSGHIDDFPFDILIADECQRYIGETDGYSILLAARAAKTMILALSATPQLHAPKRMQELLKIFDSVKTFSVEEPGIKEHMPERLLLIKQVKTPTKLLKVYHALGELIRTYHFRIGKMYGPRHPRNCKKHPLCRAQLALRMLRLRLVEDGASSVREYGTWRFRDLRNKRKSLEGDTIFNAYQDALKECENHKIDAALQILKNEVYKKAIVYVESVEAAKQLANLLQDIQGLEEIACLVGKGDMSMDQQASALFQFREKSRALVCTSVGEEGLDIPTADIEVWIDPPNNPRKWIQRFGRILRQPGDKKLARIFSLISLNTHEKNRLLSVKKTVEKTYGFTQRTEVSMLRIPSREQRTMVEYMK